MGGGGLGGHIQRGTSAKTLSAMSLPEHISRVASRATMAITVFGSPNEPQRNNIVSPKPVILNPKP